MSEEHKSTLVWFVDCSDMKDWQAHAKMKQLADYTNKSKFFRRFNLMIVPAKENKFQILENDSDFPADPKELENHLESIKNKLKDCLTKYL